MLTVTVFGRRLTIVPIRRHIDGASTSWVSPTWGFMGQKIHRSNETRQAGRTTSAKTTATTMPAAQARPSPRVEGVSESSSVRRPTITVVALARTASAVRGRARAIASRRSAWARRLVAVAGDQQQRVVRAGTEDQDREDPLRRTVPAQAGPVEQVGRADRRDPVGDPDHHERDDPQHGAAVGQHEQDRDHQHGHRGAAACRRPRRPWRCRRSRRRGRSPGSPCPPASGSSRASRRS